MTALLISTCILTVPLDMDAGSWISPTINLVEEWQFNPYELVHPICNTIGQIYNVTTSSGPEWHTTLVGQDRIFLLENGEVVESFPYSFDAEVLEFSENGEFLLMYDIHSDSCLCINLVDQSLQILDPFPEGVIHNIPLLRVTNTGSIIAKCWTYFRLFNDKLECIISSDDYYAWNTFIEPVQESSRIFITYLNSLSVYDNTGACYWTSDLSDSNFPAIQNITTNSDGSVIVVVTAHEIHILDGTTGNKIGVWCFSNWIGYPVFSQTSAFFTFSFKNAENVGIILTDNIRNDQSAENMFACDRSSCDNPYVLIPVSVSDDGLVLCSLVHAAVGHRYLLLSSSCELLWCSDFCKVSLNRFSSHSGNRGVIHNDGSGFWFFDGIIVHSYLIEGR